MISFYEIVLKMNIQRYLYKSENCCFLFRFYRKVIITGKIEKRML